MNNEGWQRIKMRWPSQRFVKTQRKAPALMAETLQHLNQTACATLGFWLESETTYALQRLLIRAFKQLARLFKLFKLFKCPILPIVAISEDKTRLTARCLRISTCLACTVATAIDAFAWRKAVETEHLTKYLSKHSRRREPGGRS